MATWDDFCKRVEAEISDASSGKSDKKSLIEIAQWAKKRGLSPEVAMKARISNLRRLSKEGKIAIRNRDSKRLEELFHLAATLTLTELQVALKANDREKIYYTEEVIGTDVNYHIVLKDYQLKRIQSSIKAQYELVKA